jgi:hypothetical protein
VGSVENCSFTCEVLGEIVVALFTDSLPSEARASNGASL